MEQKIKGKPGRKPGPHPELWKTGPDPQLRKWYYAFLQQRNQANFRNEEWLLTFEEWLAIWGDNIHRRGRQRGCMTMIRPDPFHPWATNNAEVVDRAKHSKIQWEVTNKKRSAKNA